MFGTSLKFDFEIYRAIVLQSLAFGTTIHIITYGRIPGTPPGIKAITKASRNQNALIPKNSANPPQTPAMTLSRRERRRGALCWVILCLLTNINVLNPIYGKYQFGLQCPFIGS
jgi:hypothetical protein